MAADPTVAYDDTSSVLIYSGDWSTSTWNNGIQNGTMHSTTDLTASVSFTFPVAATAFSIFVVEQNVGGYYSICVDCAPNPQAVTVVYGPLSPNNGTVPPVLLFQQSFDAPGMHTVVLGNLPDPKTPANSSLLALSSFVLAVPLTAPAASQLAEPGTTTLLVPNTTISPSAASTPLLNSTTSTSTTASATSSTSTTSFSSSSTPSASGSSSPAASTPAPPAALASSPAHRAPRLGAIIGGALGALALVCGLVVLVCWRRRVRRRRRRPTPRVWATPFKRRTTTSAPPAPPTPPVSKRPGENVAGDAPTPMPPVSARAVEDADAGPTVQPAGSAPAAPLSRRRSEVGGLRVGTAPPQDPFDADSELPPPYDDDGMPP